MRRRWRRRQAGLHHPRFPRIFGRRGDLRADLPTGIPADLSPGQCGQHGVTGPVELEPLSGGAAVWVDQWVPFLLDRPGGIASEGGGVEDGSWKTGRLEGWRVEALERLHV